MVDGPSSTRSRHTTRSKADTAFKQYVQKKERKYNQEFPSDL